MKKRLILIAILFILAAIMSSCQSAQETSKVEESFIAVGIETLERSELYIENSFSGKVFADKDVYVIPTIMAKVMKVLVKVGDKVEKDQLLFVLDKENIQKQVDQAYSAYSATLSNYNATVERIQTAKDSYLRTKELYEAGVVSKSQLEQAELSASEKPLDAAGKGLQQSKLVYTQSLKALENAEVRAPIAGTVTSVDLEVGEMALNSQPAVTIMDLDNVIIQISVPENIINKIFQGQKVKLIIESADIDTIAEIISVSSSVDKITNLYPVKLNIINNGKIKAGMFAEVKINTDIRENVLSVPGNAILQKDGKYIIYTEMDGIAHEKIVETGLDTGLRLEIISGVEAGDKIITKGQNYLSDGSKVKVVRGE